MLSRFLDKCNFYLKVEFRTTEFLSFGQGKTQPKKQTTGL